MLVLSGMKDEDDGRAIFPHSLSLAIVALCLSCLQPSKRRGKREREREGEGRKKVFHFASFGLLLLPLFTRVQLLYTDPQTASVVLEGPFIREIMKK